MGNYTECEYCGAYVRDGVKHTCDPKKLNERIDELEEALAHKTAVWLVEIYRNGRTPADAIGVYSSEGLAEDAARDATCNNANDRYTIIELKIDAVPTNRSA